jgi:hypothetical protein
VARVIEDGDPCSVLSGRLVMPANKVERDSGESDYRAVEGTNQPEDELPRLPRAGATVCLIPHPHGVSPILIVGDCRLYLVWAGPVLFQFCLYDPKFDASRFLGNIFVVREI